MGFSSPLEDRGLSFVLYSATVALVLCVCVCVWGGGGRVCVVVGGVLIILQAHLAVNTEPGRCLVLVIVLSSSTLGTVL
jgi:hypothetical protein